MDYSMLYSRIKWGYACMTTEEECENDRYRLTWTEKTKLFWYEGNLMSKAHNETRNYSECVGVKGVPLASIGCTICSKVNANPIINVIEISVHPILTKEKITSCNRNELVTDFAWSGRRTLWCCIDRQTDSLHVCRCLLFNSCQIIQQFT